MDASPSIVGSLAAVSLLLSGCITPDPSVDLLEGELRWMEDQLYMMEDQLDERCQELVACRKAAAQGKPCNCEQPTPAHSQSHRSRFDASVDTRQYDANPAHGSANGNVDSIDADPPPPSSPSRSTLQNRDIPNLLESPSSQPTPASDLELTPSDTQPPQIDLGPDANNSNPNAVREGENDFDDIENLLKEPVIKFPEPEPAPPGTKPELEGASTMSMFSVANSRTSPDIRKLSLNAAKISPQAVEDDSRQLLVVVEPRSADGHYVEMSAPLRVVLEDIHHGGIYYQAWEFNAVETGRMLRRSRMGQGIHLVLNWPDKIPFDDAMKVSVAYRRIDGEEILAEEPLPTEVNIAAVASWVPSARNRAKLSRPTVDPESVANDPFALARPAPSTTVGTAFNTVPISTAADEQKNATASWSQPASQQTLTPIANVQLERIDPSPAEPSDSSEVAQSRQRALPIEPAAALDPVEGAQAEPPQDSLLTSPIDHSHWTPYR